MVRSITRRVEEKDDDEMDVDEKDNLSISNEVSTFVSAGSERNKVLEPDRKRVTIEINL